MNCIAHRGFAGVAPENTVGAIRAAAGEADYVEFDVRRCGSGEIVVIHDETIDRVTGSNGSVSELSLSELSSVEVFDSGKGVPTLEAVRDEIPPTAGLNVELKESGLATDVTELLASHEGHVLISAFDAGVLAETAMVSEYPVALLADDQPRQRLERAIELNCAAIHPHWDLCNRGFVSDAHDAGLAVNAWTIRDSLAAVSAKKAGVDGLIVDEPGFCTS